MSGKFLFIALLLIPGLVYAQSNIYEVSNGTIRFHSDAPQELIRASSSGLQGIIDLRKRTFAFKIGVASFIGFNSPLQREHFNENYMETDQFPEASYSGKIIEDIDLSKDGEYEVRAKGKLRIHGLEQERIIKSMLIVKNRRITIQSQFIVALVDYNIKIPRIVSEKLAPDINVSVNAVLSPRG